MTIFKKATDAENIQRGEWRLEKFIEDKVIVTVVCPVCDTESSMLTHKIADDGTVTPSIVCMQKCKGSGFHDWGKLEGWTPIQNRYTK